MEIIVFASKVIQKLNTYSSQSDPHPIPYRPIHFVHNIRAYHPRYDAVYDNSRTEVRGQGRVHQRALCDWWPLQPIHPTIQAFAEIVNEE